MLKFPENGKLSVGPFLIRNITDERGKVTRDHPSKSYLALGSPQGQGAGPGRPGSGTLARFLTVLLDYSTDSLTFFFK